MPRPDVGRNKAHATLVLLCLLGLGCEVAPVPAPNADGAQQTNKAAPKASKVADHGTSGGTSWGGLLHDKIKVQDGTGKEAFSIKPEADGAKLVDASGRELARYNLKGEKLKIKGPDDNVLGYVVGSKGKFRLKDAAQKTVLFELQRQDDGDWKLKDGQGALLYKIKKRDYGFEVEDAQDQSLAKAKTKSGKVVLRDASDKELYSAHSAAVGPLPMACLALERVGDLPLRAALMVRIALEEAETAVTKPGVSGP